MEGLSAAEMKLSVDCAVIRSAMMRIDKNGNWDGASLPEMPHCELEKHSTSSQAPSYLHECQAEVQWGFQIVVAHSVFVCSKVDSVV